MEDERFAFAIDALYGVIDLPAPLRGELGASHSLTVDDVPVTLEPSPNGTAALVSAVVGVLDEAEPRRSQEANAVLREGFALTADNAAALTCDGAEVRAIARVSIERASDPHGLGLDLKRAVEDVVERVMLHGAQLSSRRGTAPAPAPQTSVDIGETMIFRP